MTEEINEGGDSQGPIEEKDQQRGKKRKYRTRSQAKVPRDDPVKADEEAEDDSWMLVRIPVSDFYFFYMKR